MKHYQDKIAIVTGGASGIGKSICKYLAKRGAKLIIADRNLEPAKETAISITDEGFYAKTCRLDVSKREEVEKLINDTYSEYGRIDYLFNNAGISVNGEFKDTTLDYWKKILDVNLWGVVYGCHYAYPIMVKQGFGHIINTSSLAGLIPGGLTTSYSASKHAVIGFTLSLRSEAKHYGIKVSALCPGYIMTNIQGTTENVSEFMNSEKNKQMNQNMKFLTPDDCINHMMKGVMKNKGVIVSPRRHKLYWWLHRLFPEFIPNMFYKIIYKMKKQA